MADCRFPIGNQARDNICIEATRILDSCRDRDCFDNARVYLTACGNELIARTGTVRTRYAEILGTSIGVDPIQFNRGFYSVSIRYYIKLICEACVNPGNPQEFEGIAVLDKNVVLYGGETGASVFRSTPGTGFCAPTELCTGAANAPGAVVEAVDPIVLDLKVVDTSCTPCKPCKPCNPCGCGCGCGGHPVGTVTEIPEAIAASLDGDITDGGDRVLLATIGLFSIVRLVRPAQYMISATEYTVPDKECFEPKESDPCGVFRNMAFPVSEFGITTVPTPPAGDRPAKRCGS